MKPPIILIPGFTGSRLVTKLGSDGNFPTWINSFVISDDQHSSSQPLQAGKWWTEQMILGMDGMTPVSSVDHNRSLSGLEAISNLAPGQKTVNGQYFFKLIQRLEQEGYLENLNLLAAPYDWRLPPFGLESRFGYFTDLKRNVERLATINQKRVILLGHSLGNRIVQYFLQWIQNADPIGGKQWIDDHISQYLAVSALWLGVPKSIHEGLVDLGHLGIMTINGVKPLYQSYGALPWMLPVTENLYKYMNTEHFAFLENDSDPLSIDESWNMGGANKLLGFKSRYYENDLNYTSERGEFGDLAVRPPYVESISVLHASGQNTEIGAYYTPAYDYTFQIKTNATSDDPNIVVENGIRLEIDGITSQLIDGSKTSGDGFLPYGSLMYYTLWQREGSATNISGYNYHGCTHYNVLENQDFLNQVIELISK